MRTNRFIGVAGILGAAVLALSGGCDLVAGIGEYCVEGVDPGCGTGGDGGTAGTSTSTGGTGQGGTTADGGGGAGGSPPCTPQSIQDCYDGPAGTVGVGVCTAGQQTCMDDGTWGPCEGQVLQGTETCASDDDEDCDGNECAIWSQIFGDSGNQSPLDVEVDGNGNVVLVSFFTGDVTIGNQTFSAGASNNLLLIKLDPAGGLLWGKSLGDSADQSSAVLAVDPANNIILAGDFKGEIDFGGGNGIMSSDAASTDIFIAKFDPAGSHLWSHSYGGPGEQELEGIAVDQFGDIAVVGAFKGTMDLGKGALTSPGSGYDIFVAKLAANGTTSWSKRYGDPASQFARHVAIGPSSAVYVAGVFGGTLDLGDGGQTDDTSGGMDVFLAKFDASSGNLLSKKILPSSTLIVPLAWAVDENENVILAASFDDQFDLGGVSYSPMGGSDVFVAEYGSSWSILWSHRLGGGANEGSATVAITPGGDLTLAMMSNGGVDFGGGALFTSGSSDVFVARFTTTGQHVWSRRFGDDDFQGFPKIAHSKDGSLALACKANGTFSFGAEELVSQGDDIVITRLAP